MRSIKRLRETTLGTLSELFDTLEADEKRGDTSALSIHTAILLGTTELIRQNMIDYALDIGRQVKESTS